MIDKNHKTGVVILTGGISERMGEAKAFLKIQNTTFLEKIISEYKNMDKLIIVSNENLVRRMKKWEKQLVKNKFPERGRFYSIKLGLAKMKNTDFCFIQNIDEPLVDEKLISVLIENKNPQGYTLPVYKKKGGHPVLLSKKIINYINSLEGFDYNLRTILRQFKRTEVPAKKNVLMNVNTKEDYFCRLLPKKNLKTKN